MSDIWLVGASELGSSGFTKTRTALHQYAESVVKHIKDNFNTNKVITANLWAFREQGKEHLSCDFVFYDKKDFSMTICTCGDANFDYIDEPDVFDMTEALHLIGIITAAINAEVNIGLRNNEVNPDVLVSPLVGNQTNGKINLWMNIS